MSIVAVVSVAVALAQAPADLETWLKAARDIPSAGDAGHERASLERIARGFEMRDVRIQPAAAHTGRLHDTLTALGASVQCHDVTARGSLIDIAYFVPAAARLLVPSVLETLEIAPVGAGDLEVKMRVAFPAMEVRAANVQGAMRVLELVHGQPRPTMALLLLARHTAGMPVRVTRVRQDDALELEALAAGARAQEALAAALGHAGIRNARVTREPRGGCTALRVTGQAAPATREEEDAARGDLARLEFFAPADALPCVAGPPAVVLDARHHGPATDGIVLKARDASRGEALALLEMATGRPLVGSGPAAIRVNLDLSGVSADEALLALREAGAPLRPFGSVHLWTDAAGPFRGHAYTGEPVSISLDCADLLDLFKLFGHITGLEFRPSPDVAGCVDVFATERPWDEVLESVLAAASLEHRIEGSKVFVTSAGSRPASLPSPPRWNVPLGQLTAADLRLMALLRKDGSWLAFAHGPVPGRLELAPGMKLADGVVRAVDESGVTVESSGRTTRLTLP